MRAFIQKSPPTQVAVALLSFAKKERGGRSVTHPVSNSFCAAFVRSIGTRSVGRLRASHCANHCTLSRSLWSSVYRRVRRFHIGERCTHAISEVNHVNTTVVHFSLSLSLTNRTEKQDAQQSI